MDWYTSSSDVPGSRGGERPTACGRCFPAAAGSVPAVRAGYGFPQWPWGVEVAKFQCVFVRPIPGEELVLPAPKRQPHLQNSTPPAPSNQSSVVRTWPFAGLCDPVARGTTLMTDVAPRRPSLPISSALLKPN